jgi:hypothetical protein
LEDVELGPRYGNINILVEFEYPIWKRVAPAPSIPAPSEGRLRLISPWLDRAGQHDQNADMDL